MELRIESVVQKVTMRSATASFVCLYCYSLPQQLDAAPKLLVLLLQLLHTPSTPHQLIPLILFYQLSFDHFLLSKLLLSALTFCHQYTNSAQANKQQQPRVVLHRHV